MKKIVVVEDDADIREVLVLALQMDCDVIPFLSGDKILESDVEVPDLFILDKNISGMNGLDLCRYIKASKKYRHVPVLMLSASSDIVQLAEEAGADGVVTKPFSIHDLRSTVSTHTH